MLIIPPQPLRRNGKMNSLPAKKLFALLILTIIPLASAPQTVRSETYEANTLPALSTFAVPEEIGKTQERFSGRNSRTIIQIQDVHAHITAQQNIAAILERLRVIFGVKEVALEGAWASTSIPKSQAIPTSREKQLLAGTLLEEDSLSGPVYAAIMSPKPITLVGIEDEASYEKNRSLFLAHLEKSAETDTKLRALGTSLRASQQSAWGAELLAFGTAFGKFRETSDVGKFFPLLLRTAETLGVAFSDLSQIILFRDILALEKSFEKERLENEARQVIKKYKDRPWTLEELIRGGKISAGEIGLYPEIKKLARLYQMRDEVSLRDLTNQIGILTGRVLEKLARTSEEKALWEKSERFSLAKKILLLQATPEDIKTYDGEHSLLETELAAAGLSESLALALNFYETVKKRDEIFFQRIMTDPSLAGDIAVVTGGFHTDGLSQKFRDAGISYITITPELGGAPMDEKLYETRMGEAREKPSVNVPRSPFPTSASTDRQTLSELRNAISTIDENFPPALEVLEQTKDIRKASARFSGKTVAISTPEKTAHLSRTGRISPGPKGADAVNVSELRVDEFLAKPRLEQLKRVREWIARGQEAREKAMLVSSVSILARMLSDKKVSDLLKTTVGNGDIVALAQDISIAETPEMLLSVRGIERFDAADITLLTEETPRFQRLAKKIPFAIMENGRSQGAYVVLPEKFVSLILFKIITLNPSLYQAAKNPAFLVLLEDLMEDILSQELSGKAA